MDQNDSKADEKDHAQRRAAERMAPKQEMRQRSAQQKNKKGEDQWVAHGGSRCLRKPDHLAASPVTLGAGLILNRDRWGRQTANHQALDPTVIPYTVPAPPRTRACAYREPHRNLSWWIVEGCRRPRRRRSSPRRAASSPGA